MTTPDTWAARTALLTWYDRNRRDLPWRETSDPYAIWVSEVMLQQTQVKRVVEYWKRFMETFPTLESLAAASLDDVLALWAGLGYYSRARRLHAAARDVVEARGGRFPEDAAGLRELPGMGEYTSAAVASIALGEEVPVLDANVIRVLSRVTGERGDARRAKVRKALRCVAAGLVSGDRPGDVNQALMELGALVCSPTEPDCDSCPFAPRCVARDSGEPALFPATPESPAPIRVRESALVAVAENRVLLTNGAHEMGWWKGLWRVPTIVQKGDAAPDLSSLMTAVGEVALEPAGVLRYTVTKHRVELALFAARLERRSTAYAHCRWFSIKELPTLAIPAPHVRALTVVGVLERSP